MGLSGVRGALTHENGQGDPRAMPHATPLGEILDPAELFDLAERASERECSADCPGRTMHPHCGTCFGSRRWVDAAAVAELRTHLPLVVRSFAALLGGSEIMERREQARRARAEAEAEAVVVPELPELPELPAVVAELVEEPAPAPPAKPRTNAWKRGVGLYVAERTTAEDLAGGMALGALGPVNDAETAEQLGEQEAR